MKQRLLGHTGLSFSILGFGCGAVGGLMVRGSPADQERAVARALDLGINYFDTAPLYGQGESERNLGRVLQALGQPPVHIGTKMWVTPEQRRGMPQAMRESLDASLSRLRRESVDLFQIHNPLSIDGRKDTLSPEQLLNELVPTLEQLRAQGKVRHIGLTALGETAPLHAVLDSGMLECAQVCYNMLNPSASMALPPAYPGQDYQRLLDIASKRGTGGIGIRVLAGGAISADVSRHPLGMPKVEPIGSGATYEEDAWRAHTLEILVQEGHAESLIDAALRFASANPALATVLVGFSTLEQLEYAAACVNRGPLSDEAFARLAQCREVFANVERSLLDDAEADSGRAGN